MKRRFFLGLAPAVLAARAVHASPVVLPSIQERVDHHAAEILALVRQVAPPELGSIALNLSENWHEQGRVGRWWAATGVTFAPSKYSLDRPIWVQDRSYHMDPQKLTWS